MENVERWIGKLRNIKGIGQRVGRLHVGPPPAFTHERREAAETRLVGLAKDERGKNLSLVSGGERKMLLGILAQLDDAGIEPFLEASEMIGTDRPGPGHLKKIGFAFNLMREFKHGKKALRITAKVAADGGSGQHIHVAPIVAACLEFTSKKKMGATIRELEATESLEKLEEAARDKIATHALDCITSAHEEFLRNVSGPHKTMTALIKNYGPATVRALATLENLSERKAFEEGKPETKLDMKKLAALVMMHHYFPEARVPNKTRIPVKPGQNLAKNAAVYSILSHVLQDRDRAKKTFERRTG